MGAFGHCKKGGHFDLLFDLVYLNSPNAKYTRFEKCHFPSFFGLRGFFLISFIHVLLEILVKHLVIIGYFLYMRVPSNVKQCYIFCLPKCSLVPKIPSFPIVIALS